MLVSTSCMHPYHRLCGPLARIPDYRSRDPGSILGAPRFFWGVVGLERGPLSLVSTTEELLGINSSGSSLEISKCGRWNSSRWPRGTLYPQKSLHYFDVKRRSLGHVVRSRTQATEFSFYVLTDEKFLSNCEPYYYHVLIIRLTVTQELFVSKVGYTMCDVT
jgi:hypothetical protein